MNKTEKAELKKAKATAKAKLEEVKKAEVENKGNKETKIFDLDFKKEVYAKWLENKEMKPVVFATLFEDYEQARPQTIQAWVSGWKKGKNLPKKKTRKRKTK